MLRRKWWPVAVVVLERAGFMGGVEKAVVAGGGRGIGACGIPRGVEKAVVAFVVRTV